MLANHSFGPAYRGDTIVFGACRPGYPNTVVENATVSEWIQFMKQNSIERIVCLLDDKQLAHYYDLLGQYRAEFGENNVFNFPIADYTKPDSEQLHSEILPVLRTAFHYEIKTLVHCSAGVGRTGAVLLAYLVKIRGFSRAKAEKAIEESRRSYGN